MSTPLELWGGVECTRNRVGEQYFDQIRLSGHDTRIDDLDKFASIGVKKLRYPLLWDWVCPESPSTFDWAFVDERLGRLRQLKIEPIVGFLHHGSGPKYTHLLDPNLPSLLSAFALEVARRYPWLRFFTPVNEPLTTARFSALYGLWYPHARSLEAFLYALVIQCKAVSLCMRQIRHVIPHAKLVQTEDLGRIFSTPSLANQAEYENSRRWLSWDLLCGRVTPQHVWWSRMLKAGIGQSDLEFFLESPSPPDILGVNHYVTSNRYLDHRLERYPAHTHGGNGKQNYADVESVRVNGLPAYGFREALKETSERYGLPVAITEAHLSCTREEQLRWFRDAWMAALSLRNEGVDVRGVTAWALLGSFYWDTLVTSDTGSYEPGAFVLSQNQIRPTAVAAMLKQLACGEIPDMPALAESGWWLRSERILYGRKPRRRLAGTHPDGARPVVVVGARGTLGTAFLRVGHARALNCVGFTRQELDIGDAVSTRKVLEELKPWAVINAAGFVRVDDAQTQRDACFFCNASAPTRLAGLCAELNIPLVCFSSDLVFDGNTRRPYGESSAVRPLNVYGESKARMERGVLAAHPQSLIVRTSAFFGPWDESNFVLQTLRQAGGRDGMRVAADVTVSPTYVPDLANATLDLLLDGVTGVWHITNSGETTWENLARTALINAGLSQSGLQAVCMDSLGLSASRPKYSALTTERGIQLPSWEAALQRYFRECDFVKAVGVPASA